MPKNKKSNQSKVVLEFWLQQGWMQYVSIKKKTYNNVSSYVRELYETGNLIAEYLEKASSWIEGNHGKLTPLNKELKGLEATLENIDIELLSKEMADLGEVLETIDLELTIIHEHFEFAEVYQEDTTYRGVESYCMEDSIIPYGFICYMDSLENPLEEKRITVLIDQPIEFIELLYLADDLFEIDTNFESPNIHISFLSEKDSAKLENTVIRFSQYANKPTFFC